MTTAWRQGDLVAPDRAIALDLITREQRDSHRVVVISHSCDIASNESVEPKVELLIAVVVTEQQASSRNGHGIRKLHVPAHDCERTEWLELDIANRHLANKADLLAGPPWSERAIPSLQRGILRRWLAQRYSRSEFPDAFVDWLKKSGVEDRFDKFAKRYSADLVGIYFDLDDDGERHDPNEPYALGIHLVYDTSSQAHAVSAEKAAKELSEIFNRRCQSQGEWRWFELLYCEAVSDEVFTLRAASIFRRWRFEHRSIAGEPLLDASN